VRKFILWNGDKTSSFDFNTQNAPVIDVDGLGISYIVKKSNGRVVGYERDFDPINLKIYFGVGANAYTCFSDFASFIASNGKSNFILEYQVDSKTLFTNVWVKKLPKGQKTGFGTIEETLTLERVSNWYTLQSGSIPTSPDGAGIENLVFDDLPINLEFVSTTGVGTVEVSMKQGSTLISKIQLSIQANETIQISAEEKTITVFLSGAESNGYTRTNKTYDSFLIAEKGIYSLSITANTTIPSTVTYSYKKWVLD